MASQDRIALALSCRLVLQGIGMSSRVIEEKKPNKRTEETFDFPETSDFCDFGYVLAKRSDAPAAPQQPHVQPAE